MRLDDFLAGFLAGLFVGLVTLIMSGCASQRCKTVYHEGRYIQICSDFVCRDPSSGKYIPCPGEKDAITTPRDSFHDFRVKS